MEVQNVQWAPIHSMRQCTVFDFVLYVLCLLKYGRHICLCLYMSHIYIHYVMFISHIYYVMFTCFMHTMVCIGMYILVVYYVLIYYVCCIYYVLIYYVCCIYYVCIYVVCIYYVCLFDIIYYCKYHELTQFRYYHSSHCQLQWDDICQGSVLGVMFN